MLTVITSPTEEPVSRQELKDWMKVDSNEEDRLIDGILLVARQHVEDISNRRLITQTLELTLDRFPARIFIPAAPVVSITSVKYVDTAGVEQTLDAADYETDVTSEPARIQPAYGKTWPSTRDTFNAVKVRFVAGYGGSGSVPREAKIAMFLVAAHLFENREETTTISTLKRLPFGIERLLASFRMRSVV